MIFHPKALQSANSHGGLGQVKVDRLADIADLNLFDFVEYVELDPGASIGAHEHSESEELYFVISGRGTAELDERPVSVSPGDLIVVSPGGRHCLTNGLRSRMKLLVVQVSKKPLDVRPW